MGLVTTTPEQEGDEYAAERDDGDGKADDYDGPASEPGDDYRTTRAENDD